VTPRTLADIPMRHPPGPPRCHNCFQEFSGSAPVKVYEEERKTA
jgi:hypothetical protein